MNEIIREKCRDLFEEGVSNEAAAKRLEIGIAKVRTWRAEWRDCAGCGVKLLRPTGICGFCRDEDDIEAGRMDPPGAWWEGATAA